MTFVYRSEPKRGRCHAGNIGLSLARGELIGFLDDDDLLYADHVETLAAALLEHPQVPAAFAHAWDVETRFAPAGWTPYTEAAPRDRMRRTFDRRALWVANYIPIQAVLFRRSLYQKHGGFHEALDALEDWDLWQRYALEGDFLYVDKTTSTYRTPSDVERRWDRALELAGHYRLAAERQSTLLWQGRSIAQWRRDEGLGDPLYINARGQFLLRWVARHRHVHGVVRLVRLAAIKLGRRDVEKQQCD